MQCIDCLLSNMCYNMLGMNTCNALSFVIKLHMIFIKMKNILKSWLISLIFLQMNSHLKACLNFLKWNQWNRSWIHENRWNNIWNHIMNSSMNSVLWRMSWDYGWIPKWIHIWNQGHFLWSEINPDLGSFSYDMMPGWLMWLASRSAGTACQQWREL